MVRLLISGIQIHNAKRIPKIKSFPGDELTVLEKFTRSSDRQNAKTIRE